MQFTPEHERAAAILNTCKNKLDTGILEALKAHRDSQRIIHECIIDFAVMFRDQQGDEEFDFARFLREASRKEGE